MRDRTDVDVDPVLDAHLRRVLRDVAETIDPGADTSSQIVRLVPSPVREGRREDGGRWLPPPQSPG